MTKQSDLVFRRQFGSYEVIERIGGADGDKIFIFHCRNALDRRTVVLKVASKENPDNVEMLRNAAMNHSRVQRLGCHPGLAEFYELNEDDEAIWLVTQLVPGSSLEQELSKGSLSTIEAIRVAVEIAETLVHIHRHSVLYLDVQPGNIVLGTHGKPVMLDFEASVLRDQPSDAGLEFFGFGGRPPCIANEVARMELHLIDGRADICSLGVVLYWMLRGLPPFDGSTLMRAWDRFQEATSDEDHDDRLREYEQLLLEHRGDYLDAEQLSETRPDLQPHVIDLVRRSFADDPRDRYASAQEFADALRNSLQLLLAEGAKSPSPHANQPNYVMPFKAKFWLQAHLHPVSFFTTVTSLAILFGCVLLFSNQNSRTILSDTFSTGVFDSTKFSAPPETIKNGGLRPENGYIRLVNRGYLRPTREFVEPIEIQFEWKWNQLGLNPLYSDHLSVALRTSAIPDMRRCGEAADGLIVKFNAWSNNVTICKADNTAFASTPAGTIPMPADEWHQIRVTDDGELVSIFVNGRLIQQHDSNAPVLTLRHRQEAPGNRIAIYNREWVGGPHESCIRNFAVKKL